MYSYRKDVSLKQFTWFKTGGNAKYFFKPNTFDDLVRFMKSNNKECITIGAGSNLLIRDKGISSCVIKLGRGFNFIKHKDNIITAGGATLDSTISSYAQEVGIGGLEFLSTIPGTIGGGIIMNAGCYGSEIADVLLSVDAIDKHGNLIKIKKEEIDFSYRKSSFKKPDLIIIGCELLGYSSDPKSILKKIEKLRYNRNETQPIAEKTGGSTFKNLSDKKAWELIKEAGCENFREGDAVLAKNHLNFIINTNSATSKEIERLMERIGKRVFEKSGYRLEREIIVIGNK